MSEKDTEEGKGFKVVDRRRFTPEGELKADAAPDRPRATAPTVAASPKPAAPAKPGEKARPPDPQGPVPEIDFMTFVASLATNALAAMGALPEGRAHGMPVDPQMAREYIDIIAMLQLKTRGNLDQQEEQAMQRLITELRMHYVEFTRAVAQPPPPRR
jgi:hypothetical protein